MRDYALSTIYNKKQIISKHSISIIIQLSEKNCDDYLLKDLLLSL